MVHVYFPVTDKVSLCCASDFCASLLSLSNSKNRVKKALRLCIIGVNASLSNIPFLMEIGLILQSEQNLSCHLSGRDDL